MLTFQASSRILTAVNHGKKCHGWRFDTLPELVQHVVIPTGLQFLGQYAYQNVDNALISAFVERWHPETNTFHLPAGEMTITLDDVFHILGVAVQGRVMMNDPLDPKDLQFHMHISDFIEDSLGVEHRTFANLQDYKKSYGLPLKYLVDHFKGKEVDAEHVYPLARAYMFFVLGAVGIPDKSGTAIHGKYLTNFLDMATIEEVSWGSGILAYLYRELGIASRVGTKTIAGCQTLLHVSKYLFLYFTSYRYFYV